MKGLFSAIPVLVLAALALPLPGQSLPSMGNAMLISGEDTPCSMSSRNNVGDPGDPRRAVTGTPNGNYSFHTGPEARPWWMIDLGTSFNLDHVTIYNRMDCCADRATSLEIYLSPDGQNWGTRPVYSQGGRPFGGANARGESAGGGPLQVALNGKVGRYLKIQLAKPNYLHLDHVEVYGEAEGGASRLAPGMPGM